MHIFNGEHFRQSAPTTYSFPDGHVFSVSDPEEVLYKYIAHNDVILECAPVDKPDFKQIFTQVEFGALVSMGKVNPRLDNNRNSRARLLEQNPDIQSSGELPAEERQGLMIYARLARRVHDMYLAGETSKSDVALNALMPRLLAEIALGLDPNAGPMPSTQEDGTNVTNKIKTKKKTKKERRINARKQVTNYKIPSASTLRTYINQLIEYNWDELAIRDHRKGRIGVKAPKFTEAGSREIMSGWVRAFMDRNRPTGSTLYRLMIGADEAKSVNQRRDAQGKNPLAVSDIPTFASVNASRAKDGLFAFEIPSLSTFRRAIKRLDKWQVCVARHGIDAARHRFKMGGQREGAIAAGEQVAMDCWSQQLATLKLRPENWIGMPEKLVDAVGSIRFTMCVALDEATKVPLGLQFSVNPNADTALRTLELVCMDKTKMAIEAGCRSTWHHACSPMAVPTDSGSEFIEDGVRWAVRDIGAENTIGPARHPDARPFMERFFETVDLQLMQHFQGRSFSNVTDKGDYKSSELANVVVDLIRKSAVRYLVDVYLNAQHAGLGGQTPNNAWTMRSSQYTLIPPPTPAVRRMIFGFADSRRIQHKGIRFLGLWYVSEKLSRLRLAVGQADVEIRADLHDLGAISVRERVEGAKWFSVPCENNVQGVSAAELLEAATLLRHQYADAAKLTEHIFLAAIQDLRAMGRHSALAAGLGPSMMSRADLLREEEILVRHFGIAVADQRYQTFEGAGVDDGDEVLDGSDASFLDESDDAKAIASRRRGPLGSDFLSGE